MEEEEMFILRASFSRFGLLFPALALLLVVGCAPKISVLPDNFSGWPQQEFAGESLWIMNIRLGGKKKFAGLLALKADSESAHLVVLDSSGFTLLEEKLSAVGPRHVVLALDVVEKHGLPAYLAKTMGRILFEWPSEASCQKFLRKLCWASGDPASIEKRNSFGPFSTWQVLYTLQKPDNQIKLIEYTIPLVANKLSLQRIE